MLSLSSGLLKSISKRVPSFLSSGPTAVVTVQRATFSTMQGTVKWFDIQKGFGFIQTEDGSPDVFVHQSVIHAEGFRSLAEGEPVEFTTMTDSRGRQQAARVTGPGGVFVQGAPRRTFQPRDGYGYNPGGGGGFGGYGGGRGFDQGNYGGYGGAGYGGGGYGGGGYGPGGGAGYGGPAGGQNFGRGGGGGGYGGGFNDGGFGGGPPPPPHHHGGGYGGYGANPPAGGFGAPATGYAADTQGGGGFGAGAQEGFGAGAQEGFGAGPQEGYGNQGGAGGTGTNQGGFGAGP